MLRFSYQSPETGAAVSFSNIISVAQVQPPVQGTKGCWQLLQQGPQLASGPFRALAGTAEDHIMRVGSGTPGQMV